MREGQASHTAQRVAAHRLTFDRVDAPYGDPEADEQLGRDVAGAISVSGTSPMVSYLRARTAFFDGVVVNALDRGVTQVVIAAAGYDGRALRYGRPGVRWFEVDHPDTQRDKRARLDRLGLDTAHVTFVAADFTVDDVGAALAVAGHRADRVSLVLVEGVAVYLEQDVLRSLLRQLRTVAAPRSRMAISLSVDTGAAGTAARRAAFQSAVAAMGEPARTVLTVDGARQLFEATGWRAVEGSDRARRAGLVVAEPI